MTRFMTIGECENKWKSSRGVLSEVDPRTSQDFGPHRVGSEFRWWNRGSRVLGQIFGGGPHGREMQNGAITSSGVECRYQQMWRPQGPIFWANNELMVVVRTQSKISRPKFVWFSYDANEAWHEKWSGQNKKEATTYIHMKIVLDIITIWNLKMMKKYSK